MHTATDRRPAPLSAARAYRALLGWGFALFSTARFGAYLPTLWAIHASADASQHSLWTWGIWFGANATMALWLFEQDGRVGKALLVSAGNALFCGATVGLILLYR